MILTTVILITILSLPIHVNAWTTVTDNYDWTYGPKHGGGWDEYFYDDDGNIKIEHNQMSGDAYCHIKIGEKVTTPDYGEDNWKIRFQVKHRRSYTGWAGWFSYFDIVIKAELHDSSHSVDWDKTLFSLTGAISWSEDTTELDYCYPMDILDEDTDYYIVYHLHLYFHNDANMYKYTGSGYDYARFDLMYFKYEFYAAGGGPGDPPD